MAEEIITSTNADTVTDHEYNASEIQVLKGLEAVRKRPGMYIGSTGERGLHHLVYEIVDNAIDEALAGYCDHIEVKILKDNIIQVTDNGRGIPVDIQADTGLPAVTVVYTILHAGGKFGGENSGYKVAGGLHGVGASVVNACSEWLTVNVRRDGKEYEQTFRRGDPDGALKCIGTVAEGVTGTRVTFKPDPEMFKDTTVYDFDTLEKRLREESFLNAGVKITLTDERQLYTPVLEDGQEGDPCYRSEVMCYEGGIKSFVTYLGEKRKLEVLHPNVIYLKGQTDRGVAEIALQYNSSYNELLLSFANNVNTPDGGTHEEGFKASLTRVFNDYGRSHGLLKDKDENLSGADVREGLICVISVKLQEAEFEGQTKAKLGNTEIRTLVSNMVYSKLMEFFEENPGVAKAIFEKATQAARARAAAKKARELVRRKSALETSRMPGKLADCRENPMLQQLYREEEAREAAWETARKAVEQVGGDIRVCEKQIASCEVEQSKAVETAAQSREAAEAFFAQHPLLEPLAQERKKGLMTGGRTARAAAQTAEKAQTRLDDALRAYLTSTLEPAQRDYNEHYVCDYPLGLAGVEQYRAQHDSLVRIDLERYAARLEQAQRDCKDRFRKDILFRMKDDIFNARRQFRELNKVMEQLTYGEEVYRFELEPSRDPQLAAFYQVIVDKGNQQMTDGDSLDNLAATADPVYERQVDALMEKIMADVDENTRARQEGRTTSGATLSDYVDYRTYLDYDIKVTNTVSGQQAYLSRVSRDSSGGENQAPFYVAICASLLQIYQKSENSIRLVLLDEAFSKMTSDRIRPMMELFRRLQLQVLLISTVEKSTAIQPYCDITYSIVRHGDANAIAPFYRAGTLADALEKETEYE